MIHSINQIIIKLCGTLKTAWAYIQRIDFVKTRQVRFIRRLENSLPRFSTGERFILYVLSALLAIFTLSLFAYINNAISVKVPSDGGTIVEGETTLARFINPVLAITDADKDISMLVFSGLMRARPDGSIIPDLAERYTISPDGKTYTFEIRPDATFHDTHPVTSSDIAYTISLAQNPNIKSSHRADWEGITIATPDEHTVIFTLPRPYAPFLENATIGILPKHLWENVKTDDISFSKYNTHPVGSGPYMFDKISIDATGTPTRYDLIPFKLFTLDGPYISHISFVFFNNDSDLLSGFADGKINTLSGYTPQEFADIAKNYHMLRSPLPRTYGVFFNQSHNDALTDIAVRKALSLSVDKQSIIDTALNGFGTIIDSPIPPGVVGSELASVITNVYKTATSSITSLNPKTIETAREILRNANWKYDESTSTWSKSKTRLSLHIAAPQETDLEEVAQKIANDWRSIGAQVDVDIYPMIEFNNSILRSRNYDAILFGEVIGRSADLFSFWHSSQRNDPGLNIAMYANAKSDTLLSQARTTLHKNQSDALYKKFADEIKSDIPAIFLFAPDYLYVFPKELKGVKIESISDSSERFLNVHEWHTSTRNVWSFLVPDGSEVEE